MLAIGAGPGSASLHDIGGITTNMATAGAAVFGGYLVAAALLITLAITRHDRLLEVSRAIVGDWNYPIMLWQVASFLITELGVSLRVTAPAEAGALLLTLIIISRALNAALYPRVYDLRGLALTKAAGARRIHGGIDVWVNKETSLINAVCIRGLLSPDDILKRNKLVRAVHTRSDGMVYYRYHFARILNCLNARAGTEYSAKAWLGWKPGDVVRAGYVLRLGVPGTVQDFAAFMAITVRRLDVDHWDNLRRIGESAANAGDVDTFEVATDILVDGFRALRYVHDGQGPSYGDMWPAGVGAPEAFALGNALTSMVLRLGRSRRLTDAGALILQIVRAAMDERSLVEAARWFLDNAKQAKVDFDPADLGRTVLRQRLIDLHPTLIPVWAAFQEHFLARPTAMEEVAAWLDRGGTKLEHLKGRPNLIGALVILSGAQASATANAYVGADASELAQTLQAARVLNP